jgi:hypothetical protein
VTRRFGTESAQTRAFFAGSVVCEGGGHRLPTLGGGVGARTREPEGARA